MKNSQICHVNIQAKETYLAENISLPSYIVDLEEGKTFEWMEVISTFSLSASPMRQRQDSLFSTNGKKVTRDVSITLQHSTLKLLVFCCVYDLYIVYQASYDAWEEDIAVINIFFGKETIIGHLSVAYHQIL